MAKKKPESTPPEKRADMTVVQQESKSRGAHLSDLAVSPTFRAAITERQIIGTTMSESVLNLGDVNTALTDRFLKVTKDGDMTTPEAMLLAQSHTCESLFHELVRRSLNADTLARLETYMKLALRAQQQSASTLRVLAEMKAPRPPVSFVKQQNVGHNVQVNNGVAREIAPSPARAHEENGNQSNELLEHHHGEWLDTGATGEAAGSDKAMATVGAVNRADKR